MKDVDSCDEYEKIVKNQKRNLSKCRGKTEEKLSANKAKIFISCRDKVESNRNSKLIPVTKSLDKKLIKFNDGLDISFSEEPEKKEKDILKTLKISSLFAEDKPIFKQKLTNNNNSKDKALYNSYNNNFNRYYDLYQNTNQKVLLSSQEFSNNNMTSAYMSPKIHSISNKMKHRNKSNSLRKITYFDKINTNNNEFPFEELKDDKKKKSDFGYASSSDENDNKSPTNTEKIKIKCKKSLFNTEGQSFTKLISRKIKNFPDTEIIENNNDLQNKFKEYFINDEVSPKKIQEKNNKNSLIQSDISLSYKEGENAKELINYFASKNNYIISAVTSIAKEVKGEKCQNEDSYLIKENIFDKKFNIYGVFDGHGKDSHLISKKISECVDFFFGNKEIYQNYSNKIQLRKNSDNLGNEDFQINLALIKSFLSKGHFHFIKKCIKYCEKKLNEENLNIKFSGSTCVLLFVINDKLICSNIGDSRCLLFKCSQDGKWSYINLSIDHKPSNEEEKTRILSNGGEVHPFIDTNGKFEDNIQRVWVKDKQYPGLAISRSIGDSVGKKIGVISEPTFICKKLENRSKFIILGSDGFWDMMKPPDIIHIVKPFLNNGDAESASKALAEKAKKLWGKFDDERDDITVIVIFVKIELPSKYNTNLNIRLYDDKINI